MQKVPAIYDYASMAGHPLNSEQDHVIWLRDIDSTPILAFCLCRLCCCLSGLRGVVDIDIVRRQSNAKLFFVDQPNQPPAIAAVPRGTPMDKGNPHIAVRPHQNMPRK